MRVFVTGATGFIGAHFIERALGAGHTVTGLYRSKRFDDAPISNLLRERGASLLRGDILHPESFESSLNGVDCVCHFAGALKSAITSGSDVGRRLPFYPRKSSR